MSKIYGRVCFYRPHRTRVRHFKPCDAARVAKSVVDTGMVTPEVVLACIAGKLGFTHISLSRESTVQAGVNISKQVNIIKLGIQFLKRSLEKFNFPKLIAILDSLANAIQAIEDFITLDPPSEKVEDVLKTAPADACPCVKSSEVK